MIANELLQCRKRIFLYPLQSCSLKVSYFNRMKRPLLAGVVKLERMMPWTLRKL
jgi:hypothetical protein